MLAVAVSRSAVSRTTSVRPPLWPVISFSVVTLTCLAIALRLRRVDGDGVDEGVAAHERGPQIVQRGVARGIVAVGDEHDRGALARPVVDEGQRRDDRVVDRGAARRLQLRERLVHAGGLGLPAEEQRALRG